MRWEENLGFGQDSSKPIRIEGNDSFPTITVLMVTFNRLEYTQQAIAALFASDCPNLNIVIWDNCSSDGTRQWLMDKVDNDNRVSLLLSSRNVGCTHPMNVVWGSARTPLLAKVDNDTLIPPDLLSKLATFHTSHSNLGVVSGCHFRPEDTGLSQQSMKCDDGPDEKDNEILQTAHVGGCAVMIRRSLFAEFGPIFCQRFSSEDPYLESGWTDYQERIHRAGFINGYPLPLIFVDHMEDTRSINHMNKQEDENYKLAMRGLSLHECTESLYKDGARKLLESSTSIALSSRSDRQGERVTLFVPLAGRIAHWKQLASFLDSQSFARDRTQLVLFDTSQNGEFYRLLSCWVSTCDYPCAMVMRQPVGTKGLADLPRREATQAVKAAMATIYNQVRGILNTEFLWILEDDVLPPVDVCLRLMSSLDHGCCSVAAPYRSRFGDRFVAWDKTGRNYTQLKSDVTEVGGNGFGCVVLPSEVFCRIDFDPSLDCDRQFYDRIASTHWRARMDWSCECKHGLVTDDSDKSRQFLQEAKP